MIEQFWSFYPKTLFLVINEDVLSFSDSIIGKLEKQKLFRSTVNHFDPKSRLPSILVIARNGDTDMCYKEKPKNRIAVKLESNTAY